MKKVFMNILLYHLIIVHFGPNSLAALFIITFLGYWSELYELLRNGNSLNFFEEELIYGKIDDILRLIIEVGIVDVKYHLKYQTYGFFTVIPSLILYIEK